ncbi:MAG: acetate--CoA ligase family protein [Bacteroidota bacterium]
MEDLLNDKSSEAAKQLIEAVRKQIEIENKKILAYKKEMYRERDFKARKFYAYSGPNYYLNKKSLVFNIFIAPEGETVEFFKSQIIPHFPDLEHVETPYVVDLFCETLMRVLKMDIDLYINDYSVIAEEDEYIVAVEYLDKKIAKEAVFLVSDWFKAMSLKKTMDFQKEFIALQADFDKTLFGGPTLYSLVEAGLKRQIPVVYLWEENQFMWGYGVKQLRGRSTTFHTDGIKDTEFTMFKDMCADFLMKCGFPTPSGVNCFTEEDALNEAHNHKWPVVVKPVNGHKGQGVTTGIMDDEEVKKAFQNILKLCTDNSVAFEGALVQEQVYGTDHRLIGVGGKFVAALERVPAFVIGNGTDTIKKLIEVENNLLIRLDNARSPLCKIKIDDDLVNYLKLQNLSLESVPAQGENITLRRVANISAGGVSINVTDKIHPDNIKLVEDIASYFNVKCIGIDVLAADISKPWREGNFGIIEINAGPGVFMHLAPAYGGSIDVPGEIIMSHFNEFKSPRIPIITANKASLGLSNLINEKLHSIRKDAFFGSLTEEGVSFNGKHFHKNNEHDANVEIILRHPKLNFALFTHNVDDILDFGIVHEGADIVILDEPTSTEDYTLVSQLLEGGLLLDIEGNEIIVERDKNEIGKFYFDSPEEKDKVIFSIIEPYLASYFEKYI